jgi:hypothetical protein
MKLKMKGLCFRTNYFICCERVIRILVMAFKLVHFCISICCAKSCVINDDSNSVKNLDSLLMGFLSVLYMIFVSYVIVN